MDRIVKVTLDLEALVAEGQLTEAEAERLARLGRQSTGMLAFNLLVGFGVMAVATGVLALVPAPGTAMAIGVVLALVGVGIGILVRADWGLLGQMCIIVGALIGGGGLLTQGEFAAWAFLLVALAYGFGAALSANGLLASLAVIAVSGAVGAETGYIGEDGYAATVPDSTAAILVMLVLTGGWRCSPGALPARRAGCCGSARRQPWWWPISASGSVRSGATGSISTGPRCCGFPNRSSPWSGRCC